MTTPQPSAGPGDGSAGAGPALPVLAAVAAVLAEAEARVLVEDAHRLRRELAALLARALDEDAGPDIACRLAALSLDMDDLTRHLEDQCPSP